jgi:hypothetical protein
MAAGDVDEVARLAEDLWLPTDRQSPTGVVYGVTESPLRRRLDTRLQDHVAATLPAVQTLVAGPA